MGDKKEMEVDDTPGLMYFRNPHTIVTSKTKVPVGETMVTCPYNEVHITSITKCLMHFTNCRKKYLKKLKNPEDCKIHVCKYDTAHHIHERDHIQHLLECPKRNLRDDMRERHVAGVKVPGFGPGRMVRTRARGYEFGGVRRPKIKKIRLGQTDGEEGGEEQDDSEYDWETDTQQSQDQEEGVFAIGVQHPRNGVLNGWKQQSFRTPDPSPPKDVMEVEKIDYYADFDKKYPHHKPYNASPPFWTTKDEETLSTTELNSSDFLSDVGSDFGSSLSSWSGREKLHLGLRDPDGYASSTITISSFYSGSDGELSSGTGASSGNEADSESDSTLCQ